MFVGLSSIFFILKLYLFVCMPPVHVWDTEDSLQESVLFFHHPLINACPPPLHFDFLGRVSYWPVVFISPWCVYKPMPSHALVFLSWALGIKLMSSHLLTSVFLTEFHSPHLFFFLNKKGFVFFTCVFGRFICLGFLLLLFQWDCITSVKLLRLRFFCLFQCLLCNLGCLGTHCIDWAGF